MSINTAPSKSTANEFEQAREVLAAARGMCDHISMLADTLLGPTPKPPIGPSTLNPEVIVSGVIPRLGHEVSITRTSLQEAWEAIDRIKHAISDL